MSIKNAEKAGARQKVNHTDGERHTVDCLGLPYIIIARGYMISDFAKIWDVQSKTTGSSPFFFFFFAEHLLPALIFTISET